MISKAELKELLSDLLPKTTENIASSKLAIGAAIRDLGDQCNQALFRETMTELLAERDTIFSEVMAPPPIDPEIRAAIEILRPAVLEQKQEAVMLALQKAEKTHGIAATSKALHLLSFDYPKILGPNFFSVLAELTGQAERIAECAKKIEAAGLKVEDHIRCNRGILVVSKAGGAAIAGLHEKHGAVVEGDGGDETVRGFGLDREPFVHPDFTLPTALDIASQRMTAPTFLTSLVCSSMGWSPTPKTPEDIASARSLLTDLFRQVGIPEASIEGTFLRLRYDDDFLLTICEIVGAVYTASLDQSPLPVDACPKSSPSVIEQLDRAMVILQDLVNNDPGTVHRNALFSVFEILSKTSMTVNSVARNIQWARSAIHGPAPDGWELDNHLSEMAIALSGSTPEGATSSEEQSPQ